MNIMTLDDLAPITLGFTDEAKGEMKELTSSKHNPCSRDHQDNQQREEEEEEEEEEEDEEEETCGEETNDYQSDFESASRSEPGYSASEIYERLGGDGEEDGETDDDGDTSEIREEGGCQGQGKRDRYSSDVSHGNSSQSWGSKMSTLHSGSSTPSSDSYSACTVTPVSRSRRRTLPERAVREAAVQTQPGVLSYAWSAGMATMDPSLGMAFVDPTPVATHTISAETVQALSTYSPAVFALNDMLRQQLAMTRRFVQASRHLHTTLVQSLGPADYTYTTLQDLKELIRKLRPAKLTVDQAKQEVLQEMRDHHYI